MHPDSLQAFLQYLVDNPTCLIKTAAHVAQIKYQRATAIWRQYRTYIETQREAARVGYQPIRNQSQVLSANFDQPQAIASPADLSAFLGQEHVDGEAAMPRDQ